MHNRTVSREGFTIVELLIAIVIIGILAAITVVAYSGIQNRAYDASVQADLKMLANKTHQAMLETSNGGAPAATQAGLQTVIGPVSRGAYNTRGSSTGVALQYCISKTGAQYFAWVGVSKSGNVFTYNSAVGSVKQSGTIAAWAGVDAAYTCGHPQTTNDTTNYFDPAGSTFYVVLYGQQGSNTAGPFSWASWVP